MYTLFLIFWSGYGFLVYLIVFVVSLFSELITRFFSKDDQIYSQSNIPVALSLLISAALIKALDSYLKEKKDKTKEQGYWIK